MSRSRLNAPKQAAMLKLMTYRSTPYTELAEVSGLSPQAIATWIKEMRKAGLVCIGSWARDVRGYPTVPCFQWNPGAPDAIRPSIPRAQLEAARRQRKKLCTQELGVSQ